MKEKMIMWVIGMFLERMTEDQVRKWVDMGLDLIEDAVEKSENKYDDMVVLPMCKLIRESFDIPDND